MNATAQTEKGGFLEGTHLPESWQKKRMGESFWVAAFLSVSGGLQDAYTYIAREQVFANAQTGNVVLLTQRLFSGSWEQCLPYLLPLISFSLGVAIAEQIEYKYQNRECLQWRQIVLLLEIALLFGVGFFPGEWNLAANSLVSISCAMQVQAFRKVKGFSFASTMCIGNLRSGVEMLCSFLRKRDRGTLHGVACYFGVIALFAIGAGVGGFCIGWLGYRTIWLSGGLLLIGFMLLFLNSSR